jgi:hypothetical protein
MSGSRPIILNLVAVATDFIYKTIYNGSQIKCYIF